MPASLRREARNSATERSDPNPSTASFSSTPRSGARRRPCRGTTRAATPDVPPAAGQPRARPRGRSRRAPGCGRGRTRRRARPAPAIHSVCASRPDRRSSGALPGRARALPLRTARRPRTGRPLLHPRSGSPTCSWKSSQQGRRHLPGNARTRHEVARRRALPERLLHSRITGKSPNPAVEDSAVTNNQGELLSWHGQEVEERRAEEAVLAARRSTVLVRRTHKDSRFANQSLRRFETWSSVVLIVEERTKEGTAAPTRASRAAAVAVTDSRANRRDAAPTDRGSADRVRGTARARDVTGRARMDKGLTAKVLRVHTGRAPTARATATKRPTTPSSRAASKAGRRASRLRTGAGRATRSTAGEQGSWRPGEG